MVVVRAPFDGAPDWLPAWHVAPMFYSDRYAQAVHIDSDAPGTSVQSWVAEFTVDLEAIDSILDEVTGTAGGWAERTVTCADLEGNLPVGLDDHGVYLESGRVSYYSDDGMGIREEVFVEFLDDPTCSSGSDAWQFMIIYLLDPETLHRSGSLRVLHNADRTRPCLRQRGDRPQSPQGRGRALHLGARANGIGEFVEGD